MPTIIPTVKNVVSSGDLDVYLVQWIGVANGDTCLPYAGPGWADRNVHVIGTLGAGFHCKFDGSNFGDSSVVPAVAPTAPQYSPLTFGGSAIDMTAVGFSGFDIVPQWTRPVVTGDGTTLVDISLVVRRTK